MVSSYLPVVTFRTVGTCTVVLADPLVVPDAPFVAGAPTISDTPVVAGNVVVAFSLVVALCVVVAGVPVVTAICVVVGEAVDGDDVVLTITNKLYNDGRTLHCFCSTESQVLLWR